MSTPPLVVRPLSRTDEAAARAAHAELAAEGVTFLHHVRDGEPWAAYLDRLERIRRGDEPGLVASTFLVGEVDGVLVGRLSVRHQLDDWLATWGGHIGYAVRPGQRRRGHATALLGAGLELCGRLGVDPVLLTCDVDNVGSAAVIERCGGVFEAVAPGTHDEAAKRRYWVPAREPGTA